MSSEREIRAPMLQAFDSCRVPLEGTILVEASAGTGKTYAIATLFVRLLLERGLCIDQILVLTFTEAATAELRDRVRKRLRDAVRAFELEATSDSDIARLFEQRRKLGNDPRRDLSRLRVALENVDEAAIQTIHGFCHKVLRDSAFQSGLLFDTELISDDSAMQNELIHDFWAREVATAPLEAVELLDAQQVSPRNCRAIADRVSRHPDARVVFEPALGHSLHWYDELLPGTEQITLARFRRDLIAYLRRELPLRKAARGVLSFDDLLHRLHSALSGASGAELRLALRQRFPAALIDEFQDTDPTQYSILAHIYGHSGARRDFALFLIGDPKQAIYSFRGADVFAYMSAVRKTPLERRFTMTTNWRSHPELVSAVNSLFSNLDRPFLLEDIRHPEVSGIPSRETTLVWPNAQKSVLQILFARRVDGQKFFNKADAERLVGQAVAADICELLTSGANVAGRPVSEREIAVLTRTNQQAFDLQRELHRAGIRSVVLGDESVFKRPEAGELGQVLAAVADPSDGFALRAALTSELFGVTAAELEAMDSDEPKWDSWLEDFRHWHDLWLRRGFVQMFRALLASRDIQRRLLTRPDGERRMTNLLHLMELLHGASKASDLGPAGLVHWLHQQRSLPPDEQTRSELAQVRLESDEDAVKLLTVHKSKGLEFGIVYCPYLWHGAQIGQAEQKCFLFHDPEDSNTLKLALDDRSKAHQQRISVFEWERFAESLRLMYVALTRAKYRCVVLWGALSQNFCRSALAYVLHWPSGRALPDCNLKLVAEYLKRSDADMLLDLERSAQRSGGQIAVREIEPNRPRQKLVRSQAEHVSLDFRRIAPASVVPNAWRTASFSTLASASQLVPIQTVADEGRDRDELSVDEAGVRHLRDAELGREPALTLALFPKGAKAGNFFHELLETLDFQRPELEHRVDRLLLAYGYALELKQTVMDAINTVLDTPLSSGPRALRLRDVRTADRLNELEFYFPVAGRAPSYPARTATSCASESELRATLELGLVTQSKLARVFATHPSPELLADYAERVRRLQFVPLEGYLKGYVDLVFVHERRWYVVDYKTNHLGDTLEAYERGSLSAAMANSHYYLQYHLYALAVHRYLSRRLKPYSYAEHFGGVYYLFIKGMTPHTGPANGVFFERPPLGRIEMLSELFRDPTDFGSSA